MTPDRNFDYFFVFVFVSLYFFFLLAWDRLPLVSDFVQDTTVHVSVVGIVSDQSNKFCFLGLEFFVSSRFFFPPEQQVDDLLHSCRRACGTSSSYSGFPVFDGAFVLEQCEMVHLERQEVTYLV